MRAALAVRGIVNIVAALAAWLVRNNETHVQHLLLYVGLFFHVIFTEGVKRRI